MTVNTSPLVSHLAALVLGGMIVLLLIEDDSAPSTQYSALRVVESQSIHRPDSTRVLIRHKQQPLRVSGEVSKQSDSTRCLDTLLYVDSLASAPDTLSVCIIHNSVLYLTYAPSPREWLETVRYVRTDSIVRITDSITTVVADNEPWYEHPLLILASALAGFLLGSIR